MFAKPTLIINEAKTKGNIRAMIQKADQLGIAYRPHFKTHQSHEVGRWFRELGVSRIAVSSLPMAQYFALDGWNDITVAFPYVHQFASLANELAKKVALQLIVSSAGNAIKLQQSINERVNVLVEIDAGQGRTGMQPYDLEGITDIVKTLSQSSKTNFIGFLAHAGHTYNAESSKIRAINTETLSKIYPLKGIYPGSIISYGDTPTSSICEHFDGVDELRPGNNTFFDMQQASKGICEPSQVAVAMACPLVAVYPDRNMAAIWGGAVHLSKDFYIDSLGNKSFGAICKLNSNGTWSAPIEGLYIESLSQEHGMIRATHAGALKAICEDDIVAVLPAHSCLTVDANKEAWIDGRGYIKIGD